MSAKWTDDQKSVIETTDRNLLVSAAAGSGKTAVLVERILRMVTDRDNPTDIDRFIIMTFTRAAAAQMRQKIAFELEKLQLAEPDNMQVRRQLRLLNNACISTIDSFCIGIVRDYFHVLNLDPSFRVVDDTELALIKSDCMEEVMGRWYEKKNSDPIQYSMFSRLLEGYCNHKGDGALMSVIYSLADKAISHPWPLEWLEDIRKDYSMETVVEFDSSMVAKATVSHVHLMLQGADSKLEKGIEMCGLENGPDYFLPALTADLELVKKVLAAEKYSEMSSLFSGYSFMRLSSSKKGDAELRSKVSEIRGGVKDCVNDIISKFFFYGAEEILETIIKSKDTVDGIISLTVDYLESFSRAKSEKNVIDFSDAEHFALEILLKKDDNGNRIRSAAALELQKQYHEIIIDEYQDSNEIQECIVNAIAGNPSERPFVFTVGDVKQSIYKFRNACPEIFMEKQKLYGNGNGSGKLIMLDRNFRSREEVLEGTNAIFYQIMHENHGGIEYDGKCSLKCGTDGQRLAGRGAEEENNLISWDAAEIKEDALWANTPYITELVLINREESELRDDIASYDTADEDGSDTEELAAENAREREARAAAKRIRHLVFDERLKVKDEINGKTIVRNVGYGDIVILLRTMKGWADVFCRIFEEEGIPAISDVSDGFFKSSEIMLVLDLLKVIDNPRRDIPLTAVLSSVIGGFDVNDLADVKIAGKRALLNGLHSFYDELLAFYGDISASDNNGEVYGTMSGVPQTVMEKAGRFLSLYDELCSLKNDMSIAELISEIYKKTDIYSYYSAMPDGEKRSGNLDLLLGYAADYENTGYTGLFSFIRYLDKLKSKDQDYGEAGNSRAVNCVRIMSIHKSKGLEFPVVLIAGAGKAFNKQDMHGDIIVSSDHGLGIKYVDTEKRIRYNSFHHSVINIKYTGDMVGEEMRLLYVAMTRAKEKLIMMGTPQKLPTELSYKSLFNASSFIDFLYIPAITSDKYIRTLFVAPEEAGDYAWTQKYYGDHSEGCPEAEGTELEAHNSAIENKAVSGDVTDEILRIRELEYPYTDESVLPVKLSVSDLKLEAIEEAGNAELLFENEIFDPDSKTVPRFIKETAASGDDDNAKRGGVESGTQYGTLMHKVMQFIPMNCKSTVQIMEFLKDMLDGKMLSEEEYHRIRPESFAAFMNTDIAERIRRADAAGNFMREKQFMMGMQACEVNPEKYGDSRELIPVQGVIDAMFEEDGELVILDYKTDRVPPDGADILISRYKLQLELYARAAWQLTGMRVKEMYLYSFALDKEIKL